MDRTLRLLLVEDSEDDAHLLVREVRRGGYEPVWTRVDTPDAMQRALSERAWDVIICNHGMPHFNAPGALATLRQRGLDVPFIVVSGTIGEDLAVAAMKAGAQDYLTKDKLTRLVPAIEREVREALVRQERRRAQCEQRKQAQVSAALAHVGRELIAALGSPALLDRLCEVTAIVLKCEASYTLLWEPSDAIFVPVAGFGPTPQKQETVRALKLPRRALAALLSEFGSNDVVETAAPVLDPLADGAAGRDGGCRHLCMALRRGTEIIALQTATAPLPFSSQQWRIGSGIAQLASMALEQTRLVSELERANRLKSDFLATVSHELRTPLNVVMGYTELLQEGSLGPLIREQLDVLRRMQRSSGDLLDLVNAMLDLNRLDAGCLPVDLRDTSVGEILSELEDTICELNEKPALQVVWKVAPGLPWVHTDAGKLKMILKNLLVNALKFTAHGRVTIEARGCDGGVEVTVADTGIGIPPDKLPIIFEAFRQLEPALTRHHGGVGLGLHIVWRLLDVLGGTISVESEVGRGSTFRVYIPAAARVKVSPLAPQIEMASAAPRA